MRVVSHTIHSVSVSVGSVNSFKISVGMVDSFRISVDIVYCFRINVDMVDALESVQDGNKVNILPVMVK